MYLLLFKMTRSLRVQTHVAPQCRHSRNGTISVSPDKSTLSQGHFPTSDFAARESQWASTPLHCDVPPSCRPDRAGCLGKNRVLEYTLLRAVMSRLLQHRS